MTVETARAAGPSERYLLWEPALTAVSFVRVPLALFLVLACCGAWPLAVVSGQRWLVIAGLVVVVAAVAAFLRKTHQTRSPGLLFEVRATSLVVSRRESKSQVPASVTLASGTFTLRGLDFFGSSRLKMLSSAETWTLPMELAPCDAEGQRLKQPADARQWGYALISRKNSDGALELALERQHHAAWNSEINSVDLRETLLVLRPAGVK